VLVGNDATFRVEIENTGTVTLDVIEFNDFYNSAHLLLQRVYSVNPQTGVRTGVDLSNFERDVILGTIHADDLTTFLGDLASGQKYMLDFEFRVVNVTSNTCNNAAIEVNESNREVSSRACISTKVNIPVTDN
jgi:hypothetical protein